MPGLVRTLRDWVRGTERARVVSDAATTFVIGLGLLAVGLVGPWGGGPALATDRWWFVLTLAAMCAVMLGKSRPPLAPGSCSRPPTPRPLDAVRRVAAGRGWWRPR